MKPEDVRKMVAQIVQEHRGPGNDWDSEYAHRDEDALYLLVLGAIANGADDAAGLAREALRTQQYGFSRWCR